jgi:hypothetical protein
MKRLRAKQPRTKNPVIELVFTGPIARTLRKHNWAAFTLPLPFVTVIFYWLSAPPVVRTHEFTHVAQSEEKRFYVARYIYQALTKGYGRTPYELEAYASAKNPLPTWATT